MESDQSQSIFFCGDPHGQLQHIVAAVMEHKPVAIVLLGDIMAEQPLDIELTSILDLTQIWWIHGNHDTDNEKYYDNLFNSRLGDRNLHGRVVEIAGLGGVFRNKVWNNPQTYSPAEYLSMCGKGNQWRGGLPMKHRSSIFKSEIEELSKQSADILVTHEGPSMHPLGKQLVTELAKSMSVKAAFHGHLHEDLIYDDGVWRGVGERSLIAMDIESSNTLKIYSLDCTIR